MASRNRTSASSDRQSRPVRSNSDSARWTAGLLLLFVGLYACAAVFFSFFSWPADQSGLLLSSEERMTLGVEPENLCGWSGARLARLLVDDSFGVMGILIPAMLTLIGVRIIRQRPLLFNQTILSAVLVLILGSLTFGFAFGDKWSLCCSTGWGGRFGIGIAGLLGMHIGWIGMVILLLGGWILTGVFINRNFINTVNEAGNAMVDKSGKLFETVRQHVAPGTHPIAAAHDDETELARRPSAAQPVSAQPAVRPEADSAAPRTAEPAAAERSDAPPQADAPEEALPVAEEPAAAAEPRPTEASEPATIPPASASRSWRRARRSEVEDPFIELTPDAPQGVSSRPNAALRDGDMRQPEAESAFVRPQGRVVMGPGGLVELEHPSHAAATPLQPVEERPAEPSAAGQIAEEEFSAENPFEELFIGGEVSADELRPDAGQTEPLARFGAERSSDAPDVVEPESFGFEPEPLPEPLPADDLSARSSEPLRCGDDAAGGLVVTVEEHEARLVDERAISTESYDPLKDLVNYRKPPVTLLEDYVSDSEVTDEEIFENKTRIEETLKNFGIPIQRIKATVGPTVTLYEIVQAQGVKISRIQGLQNDIAQSLKAESGIRIIAPIPGRGTIGIEVPNRNKQIVSMYSAVRSLRFQESKAELPVVIGRTIQNENYVFDLAKLPHLLVAGATGMGKSVGLNAIITSLLYRKHPAQLKLVMIDPKMVEFSLYARIERHFLARMESEEEAIITDPKKAVYTLNALCTEMDNRLELCKNAGARNIKEYNDKFTARRLNPQKGHRYLPYVVVVIDEFADLIMMAKEVEIPVTRLAQKARAVGIHLIVATQRPSVDVITGKIKANFPARIAFRVMQMIDSRTIIDQPGANQLIGRGDMLFSKDGQLTRVQCALVETAEVERIVDHIARQQGYTAPYLLPDYTPEGGEGGGLGSEESSAPVRYDALFPEIAREAVSSGQISTSMIQRNYEVGFNRAGRIMLQLERAGIVGRQQGAKPRDILFHDLPSLEAKLQDLGVF